MEILGIIKAVSPKETINDKLTKQTLLVETQDKYPQVIPVDFYNDKIPAVNQGDNVKVQVNLRSREYKGKYYVSLNGWKVATNEEVTNNHQNQDRELIDGLAF